MKNLLLLTDISVSWFAYLVDHLYMQCVKWVSILSAAVRQF